MENACVAVALTVMLLGMLFSADLMELTRDTILFVALEKLEVMLLAREVNADLTVLGRDFTPFATPFTMAVAAETMPDMAVFSV